MNPSFLRYIGGRLEGFVRLKLALPTGKALAFTMLCSWALYVQTDYRVPGSVTAIILPWLGAALTLMSFIILLSHLMSWLPSGDPATERVKQIEKWADHAFLLFVLYSFALILNARADMASQTEHKSEVLEIAELEDSFLHDLPYSWFNLRSWEDPKDVMRIMRNPWQDGDLWGGEPVLVHVRTGLFGIPWIERLEMDREAQFQRVVEVAPTAASPRKDLIYFYLNRKQWKEAGQAAREYFKLYPNDTEYAFSVAAALGRSEQNVDAVAVLEPLVARKPNFDLYLLYGWTLKDVEQRPKGADFIRAAIQLAPDRWEGYYHLGYVLRDMGQSEQAVIAFEKTLSLQPSIPEIEAEVARLRQQLPSRPRDK